MLVEIARKYEKDEWWSQHLEWLLENKPAMVRRLYEKDRGKLRMLLSQKVKQAFDLWERIEGKGLLPGEIEEIIMAEVIAPPPPENPPEPLPERLRSKILRWAENPDRRGSSRLA